MPTSTYEVEPTPQNVERVYKVVATAYAPHDPKAIKGVCHDGNPDITASGTYPTPGRTIAVDPNVIPLGSKVSIEGLRGIYIAEDVGRLIKDNMIDICMATQEEALKWGRKEVVIIIFER